MVNWSYRFPPICELGITELETLQYQERYPLRTRTGTHTVHILNLEYVHIPGEDKLLFPD